MQGVKNVTKQAFMKSIPIMCSYIFVSMAYGLMMEKADKHFPAVAGVLIAVIALMIFGQRAFMLPALVIVSGVLIFWNSKQQEV